MTIKAPPFLHVVVYAAHVCSKPIDLFCSLIFMPSVTEIRLKKLRARFPA